jgi:hypothetical protein
MAGSRSHYVRGDRRREDGAARRTGDPAFAVFPLPAIALNLLRTAPPRWRDETRMTLRSIAADYAAKVADNTLLHKPPWIRRDLGAPVESSPV